MFITKIVKASRPIMQGLAAAATLATATHGFAKDDKAFSVDLTIQADQPGGTIHRNIYGQFMEHLGRGIYEGIWVGEDSDIPNTDGYRDDVMAALKQIEVPLLRWPGGCFADEYHWRDGIGPRDKRPVRLNRWWGGVTEDNAFGTHEFMEFAERLGADVYINGNLGSGTPQEMAEWMEYLTSDSESTIANLRRENGRDEPWTIHHFGIGNEPWACGGHISVDFYVNMYRRYQTFAKYPSNTVTKFIASLEKDGKTDWTESVMKGIPLEKFDGIGLHYYTVPTGNWDSKGKAIGFGEDEYISTISNTLLMDKYLDDHIAVIDKHDPTGKIKLYVDEWGIWSDPEEGDHPGFLYQQNSLRDALSASLNLNLFHKYHRRVEMTSVAQMINVLQAMILTREEEMVLTPTYHVFDMYTPFHDATFLPVDFKTPSYRLNEYSVPAISATSARGEDGKLYLAVTNVDPHRALKLTVNTDGVDASSAKGRLLTAPNANAHNTFEAPDQVKPVSYEAEIVDGALVMDVPPKSLIVVALE